MSTALVVQSPLSQVLPIPQAVPAEVFAPLPVDHDVASNPSSIEKLKGMLLSPQTNFGELHQALQAIYGKEAVDRVFTSGILTWPQRIGRDQILRVLAAISHSLTVKDLNHLWSLWRQIGSVAAPYLQMSPLTLSNFERVEDLPSGEFQKLMKAVRNPLSILEPESSFWEELGGVDNVRDKKYVAYACYDHKIQRMAQLHDLNRREGSFAPHELLAKTVGYAKPEFVQRGMIIPVYTEGKIVYYQLESQVNKLGLHAYLFTPINGKGPAQLVFRGTNGTGSLSRDFDTAGVGKTIFDMHAPDLLQMVQSCAQKTGSLNLEVCGHSLGAADAQRAMALLADQVINNPDANLKGSLKGLKLYAYCSPKLDSATVQRWKTNLKTLATWDNPPQIELNFAEHVDDPVTHSGDFNLCSADTSFVQAKYLLVHSSTGIVNGKTHHTTPFFRDGIFDCQMDGRTFTLFEDRIHKTVVGQLANLVSKQFVPVSEPGLESWEMFLDPKDSLNEDEQMRLQAAEEHLQELQKEKAVVDSHQKGTAQHSWLVWGASLVIGQPVKLIAGFVTSWL